MFECSIIILQLPHKAFCSDFCYWQEEEFWYKNHSSILNLDLLFMNPTLSSVSEPNLLSLSQVSVACCSFTLWQLAGYCSHIFISVHLLSSMVWSSCRRSLLTRLYTAAAQEIQLGNGMLMKLIHSYYFDPM